MHDSPPSSPSPFVRVLALTLVLAASGCATAPAAPDPAAQPAPSAAAGEPAALRAAAATITSGDMYARIGFLASDALRGRDTPSQGLEAAAAYIASEFRRLGLTPAGEGGGYLQRWPFPQRRLSIDGVSVRIQAPGVDRLLRPGVDFYSSGGTVGAVFGGLVFVGREPGHVQPADETLRDRVAVYSLPGGADRDFRILGAQQGRDAEARGAIASVHILDATWTAEMISRAAERAGRPFRTLGEQVTFPQFYLSEAAGRELFEVAGVSWEEALTVAGEALDWTPIPLAGLTAGVAAPLEDIEMSRPPNVVGMVTGSDPALRDEYIILSAHMDHVGVGEPMNGDSIYNGADDNASGTSALLEVAEAMARLPSPPRRSVVFLLVSGEEKGLLGSRWYSENPTLPLERTVANINVDMIAGNAPDSVVVIGKDYSTLGRVVDRVAARHPELGLVAADDLWPEERFFFRSDHFNFARKEVPAIFFFTGVHECYHRPCDTPDFIDPDKAARVARLIFYTALEIAQADARPEWNPAGLEEVRALTR